MIKALVQSLKLDKLISVFSLIIFAYLIIGMAFLSPSVYKYFFNNAFDKVDSLTIIFYDVYSVILFFILPLCIGKLFYSENIKELGLRWPKNNKKTLLLILAALLLLIPWVTFFAKLPAFQGYSQSGSGLSQFIFIQLILLPIYYFTEEFFFRGFLFITLWKRVGYHSYWITDLLFVYAHLGKPGLEIIMAIPASIILNFLAMKTKSIYPAIVVHGTLGLLLNILVTFHLV